MQGRTWGGGEPAYPRGKCSPIRPPVKVMTAHKLRYSDPDFRLIISVYSDFSSDILKEYVQKKPRALEFSIEGRILNLCALCYLFKHKYFRT